MTEIFSVRAKLALLAAGGALVAGCVPGVPSPDSSDVRGRPPQVSTDRPQATASSSNSPSTAESAGPGFVQPTAPPSPRPALTGRTGEPRISVPALASVNGNDPVAVATAAVTTMWTMDTLTDTSQWNAMMRAAPFLSSTYVEQLRLSAPVRPPGAEWQIWAQHQAVTTATVRLADEMGKPPDTATQAHHAFLVEVTPMGQDRWGGERVTAAVFVTLARSSTDQPWRVTAVRTV